MRAYVEIFVESGRNTVLSAEFMRQLEGVKEAYAVSEHCDIMVVVEAETFKDVYELVMQKIKVIRGVVKARILPCVDMDVQPSDSDLLKLPGL